MNKPAYEPMSSGRYREAILSEHETLRRMLGEAIGLLEPEPSAATELDALRARARSLYAMLEHHMSFEERMLPPALRDVIGWGQTLEAQIAGDHLRQRHELAEALEALDAETLTLAQLAADLRVFADTLLEDMEREEAGLLNADLDALASDGEGG
jgi:hypothetical protein